MAITYSNIFKTTTKSQKMIFSLKSKTYQVDLEFEYFDE